MQTWKGCTLTPCYLYVFYGQRDDRKLKGLNYIKGSDPYNMEEIVMPLHEYIYDPIARDIVHNGATFQVPNLCFLTAHKGLLFMYLNFVIILYCSIIVL